MERSEFGSIEVVHYSDSSLINTLSELSSSTRYSIIKKDQTKFLQKYCLEKKVTHLIVEGNYVDKSFIEDFSHYYVRCFQDYYKKCSRVHFFSFDENKKVDYAAVRDVIVGNALSSVSSAGESDLNTSISKDDLQNSYLGFSVIRPIPKTIFGRTCLLPLAKSSKSLARAYKVSFFGVDLTIDSIAYQEQDKVVSACATSAIWSFLNAMPNINPLGVPSPAEITKHASEHHHKNRRTFPNDGLTQEMMTEYLIKSGFEPIQFGMSSQYRKGRSSQEDAFERFKEYVGAFIDSGLPLICMADFFVPSDDQEGYDFVAQHAFVISGYDDVNDCEAGVVDSVRSFRSKSHSVYRVLIHDDRIGPYVPFDIREVDSAYKINSQSSGDTESSIEGDCYFALEGCLEELKEDSSKNYLVIPNSLIMGVYHKIRIPYDTIANSCEQFYKVVKSEIVGLNLPLEEDIGFTLSECKWSIRLVENNALKSYYRENIESPDKINILTESWPKYIWSARAVGKAGKLFDLLFDATDIKQGNVFIRGVFWQEGWEDYLRAVGLKVFKQMSVTPKVDDENTAISGIAKWFSDQLVNQNILDDLYGPPLLPSDVKKSEFPEWSVEAGVNVQAFDAPVEESLKELVNTDDLLIWVIDAKGDLYIGTDVEEDVGDSKKILGHPTLIGGRRGRIGGEIKLEKSGCEGKYEFLINNYSGRYSWDRDTRGNKQLDKARELFDFIFKSDRGAFRVVDTKLNIIEKSDLLLDR